MNGVQQMMTTCKFCGSPALTITFPGGETRCSRCGANQSAKSALGIKPDKIDEDVRKRATIQQRAAAPAPVTANKTIPKPRSRQRA